MHGRRLADLAAESDAMRMSLIPIVLISPRVLVYSGAVARWLWCGGNRRGAVGVSLLAAAASAAAVGFRLLFGG